MRYRLQRSPVYHCYALCPATVVNSFWMARLIRLGGTSSEIPERGAARAQCIGRCDLIVTRALVDSGLKLWI